MKKTKRILSILLTFVLVMAMIPAIDITAFAETTDDGFEYEINESNEITITGYTGSATELIIPSEIDGYPVTCIGEYAFLDLNSITSITIPSSIINIEDIAIGACISLVEIKVDESNENYLSENGILFNKDKSEILCYPAGKTDTSYTIPNSVVTIGAYAFAYCENLEAISIPRWCNINRCGCFWFMYFFGFNNNTGKRYNYW